MTSEEILDQIIKYLDQHLSIGGRDIGQDHYKSDFFKLCKEAHKNGYFEPSLHPRLTGDAMRDTLRERWSTGGSAKESERSKLMEQLFAMWDEWRYVLDRA